MKKSSRIKILAALWEYIKANRLQDTENRKMINCNQQFRDVIKSLCKIMQLFGEDRIEFSSILVRIREFLEDPEPDKIHFKLKYFSKKLYNNITEFDRRSESK